MALCVVEVTVSPRICTIYMLASANRGAVSMNARISRRIAGIFTRTIFGAVGVFVNALGIHFTAGPQIIVIIRKNKRRLIMCLDRFGPQIIRVIHLWNACPERCSGAAQQQAGCGDCRESFYLPKLPFRLMCDFIHFASPRELALDTHPLMRALCQLKKVNLQ
jgi:hypothetical protein